MSSRSFVVTTSIGSSTRSRVWDGRAPLAIGHPLRWIVEPAADGGARVRDLQVEPGKIHRHAVRDLAIGKALELAGAEGGPSVRILVHPRRGLEGAMARPSTLPRGEAEVAHDAADARWFRRALQGAAVALGAFVVTAWLWPKTAPKEQELVPAQFTKIVMTQPKKLAAAPAASSAASPSKTVTKAQDAAVIQAFRAKALQSAVSGLLKGGMTRLLAQSDVVAGARDTSNARRLFDFASKDLRASNPRGGPADAHAVAVAGIGGDAGAGGSGVGYRKGEKAGVSGQGKSLVALDTLGAAVEEGLTKDEVGEVIHRHLSELRYCYEAAMIRSPDVEGKLVIDFTIGGAGAVKTSAIKQSTLPDPRLDDCIIRRLVTWKFPYPKGGIDVAVTYPFIFKALGR
jgi:outer membrane biosynthesis protein TonB